MRVTYRIFAMACGGLLLAGCSLRDRNSEFNYTSAYLPYSADTGKVSIPDMVAANVCAAAFPATLRDGGGLDINYGSLKACRTSVFDGATTEEERYAAAVTAFYSVHGAPKADAESGKLARNRVQDSIMKAADRQCGDFKVALTRADTFSETTAGLISAVTGTLGGVLTAVDATRALSATSGIASGTGAVVNKSLLKDQSIKIIYSGIDIKRQALAGEIDNRRKDPLSEYTLDHAVKDAMRYADGCNIVEALSTISDSIAKNGVTPATADSQEARAVKAIDALTLARLQALLAADFNKSAEIKKLPAPTTDADVAAYKAAYKKDALSLRPGRIGQLLGFLAQVENTPSK